MSVGRTVLSATLALSLAACGGGGSSGTGSSSSSSSSSSGGTSGGTGGGTDVCSLSSRQDWALSVLQEWYLFPELLNTSVNKANYSTVDDYIDALVAPARAEGKDRYFTYLTQIQEENELINSGSNAGFGFRLSYDTTNNRVLVAEVFESAPAYPAGFDRGTELLSINGQTVANLMASGGPQAVVNALGPNDPGITRQFNIRLASGVEQTVSVTKADYALDPISDRYGVKILNDGTQQVGYINLRTFIIQDAGPQLRTAFQQFKNAGVNKVILDLRYNGGGLVSIAELLGDLMAEGKEGQIFSQTRLRPSKASENSTERFQDQAQQIGVTKLAVIGRDGTASASELVTNSFIPYLADNIALIGANTYGKPVGQYAFDRSACDDRLRGVTFKTVNAAGQGEYFNGLAPVMNRTCLAADDFAYQMGDPNEASTRVALDYLAGRSCTAISSAAQSRSAAAKQVLLESNTPSTSQRKNPGMF